MIDELVQDERRSFTENGLKYSVLARYLETEEPLLDRRFSDGSCVAKLEYTTKKLLDMEIMEHYLARNLGINTPKILPIDLENGNVAVLKEHEFYTENFDCDSVKGQFYSNLVPAGEYNRHIDEMRKKNKTSLDLIKSFFNRKNRAEDIEPYHRLLLGNKPLIEVMEPNAIQNLIKSRLIRMSAFDTTYNPNATLYRTNYCGWVEDCVIVSPSVTSFDDRVLSQNILDVKYDSEFLPHSYRVEKAIDRIRDNLQLDEHFDKNDRIRFSKELFRADAENAEKEYKQKLGYQMDKRYAKKVLDNTGIISDFYYR